MLMEDAIQHRLLGHSPISRALQSSDMVKLVCHIHLFKHYSLLRVLVVETAFRSFAVEQADTKDSSADRVNASMRPRLRAHLEA